MKILFFSYSFAPSVGGIETVSRILASEFVAAGHKIRLVTDTPGNGTFPFPVLRQPSAMRLIASYRWAEVIFHNNISLRYAWPLPLSRKPWVVAHHAWIERANGEKRFSEKLKLRALRNASHIAVSSAVARSLPVPAVVIPNPYHPEVFHVGRSRTRARDLVFLGRLVSEKGVDVLLAALKRLADENLFPTLSIIGEGPERTGLERQTAALGLSRQVSFAGAKSGSSLAELLNEHRITVIPSRCNETFGLAALEGIACGCVVVGTSGGGLPEAIGPCGITATNGDPGELARALRQLLVNPAQIEALRSKAEAHLKKHHPATIAERYLERLGAAVRSRP